LLFVKGEAQSVRTMFTYFSHFTAASGMKANLHKSAVYFGGVKPEEQQQIIDHLGYVRGELPFKCLGVPLSTKKLSVFQWQPLVDKITARITSWTARQLSYAGRIQLVHSVIFGIQAYWAQLFLIPSKVIKLLEAICRSYIWSGSVNVTRKAYVPWEKICLPKSAGGLNLTNLLLWNKVVVAKLSWDLVHKKDVLWVK